MTIGEHLIEIVHQPNLEHPFGAGSECFPYLLGIPLPNHRCVKHAQLLLRQQRCVDPTPYNMLHTMLTHILGYCMSTPTIRGAVPHPYRVRLERRESIPEWSQHLIIRGRHNDVLKVGRTTGDRSRVTYVIVVDDHVMPLLLQAGSHRHQSDGVRYVAVVLE
jgi:hypothetical protein